jgi:transposase
MNLWLLSGQYLFHKNLNKILSSLMFFSGRDSPDPNSTANNIVIYDYQPSRAAACLKVFLQDYQGYLQVDGYAAYEGTGATLAGCMAYVR